MRELSSGIGTREEQTDRLDLAIIDLSNDQCVGEAVLNAWSPADRSCNYRILIGPEGRGCGFGSEATSLVIDYAFENTNLNRICLDVLAFNPRARRAYEKAGFVYEGTSREAFRFDGEYIDDVRMAILRSDWERKSSRTKSPRELCERQVCRTSATFYLLSLNVHPLGVTVWLFTPLVSASTPRYLFSTPQYLLRPGSTAYIRCRPG